MAMDRSQLLPVGFSYDIDSTGGMICNGMASIFDDAFNPSDATMEFVCSNSEPHLQSPQPLAGNLDQQLLFNSTYTSNVDRFWPGIQQQQVLVQVKQRQQRIVQQQKHNPDMVECSRGSMNSEFGNYNSQTDATIEKKLSQLIRSMRQGSNSYDDEESQTLSSPSLSSQDFNTKVKEMDDDEKLLASEEGKMLSSKERRQLRNKVSARAFRSRRKEYINQLEDQIAVKINEIGDLRAKNQALTEENTRLSDLTHMLLSLPSFPGFLESLGINPTAAFTMHLNHDQIDSIS